MNDSLSKAYEPQDVQTLMWSLWERARAFHTTPDTTGESDPFAIVIPPPNVTASLHLGHALNNTLQDILTRWRRMAGDNAVWVPGTDHAGIATQTVVEKRVLMEEGKRRTDFGRDEFVAKIQAWKEEYEHRITDQLKAMGCSCDWDRQRFTMDPVCTAAVREAFFRLFKDGLIYRGKRLVNWDPATQTALADDEVEMRPIDGHFYYMRYPLADAPDEFVTVATTRPETMLGDTAVAVNPNDPERAKYIGRRVRLPIVNREIPILGDDYVVIPNPDSDDAKAKYASGFLKVTPAHDPNDYEIGRRHNLAVINVMSATASISKDHGWPAEDFAAADPFATHLLGMDRYEAREAIVDWFREKGLLAEVKPYTHTVGHSYRSHVAIEPWLSDQWYVKVTDDRLSGAALRAMAEDQRDDSTSNANSRAATPPRSPGSHSDPAISGLRFYPARYAKTFQQWHENIRDWCISRQLWWGHRIPVWTAEYEIPDPGDDQPIDDWHDANNERAKQKLEAIFSLIPAEAHKDFCVRIIADEGTAYLCARDAAAEKILSEVAPKLVPSVFDTLEQDPDVLDTWFSSALWPISTMGWPEPAKFPGEFPEGDAALERWNPSSVLCTAREIITLWVSRMVMFNLYLRGCLPFRDVFIHAMIQDGEGQKMSKSLGNGVDPLDIIHLHGADAMRFTLAAMTTQTQDVRMPVDLVCPHTGLTFTPKMVTNKAGYRVMAPVQDSPHAPGKKMVTSYGVASGEVKATTEVPLARNTSSKFDDGRNFANKLWNAGKFVLSKLDREPSPSEGEGRVKVNPPQGRRLTLTPTLSLEGRGGRSLADRWIVARLAATIREVTAALEGYQFNAYARSLYDFIWRDFCDWYLEAIKPVVDTDTPAGEAARATLRETFDAILRLLHPAMPYITERLYQELHGGGALCMTATWPTPPASDDTALGAFELAQSLVGAIRNVRNQYAVPPRKPITIRVKAADPLGEAQAVIETLAGVQIAEVGPAVRPGGDAATAVVGTTELYLEGLVDKAAEVDRLTKRRGEVAKNRGQLAGRLGNPGYAAKAPPHLVQQTRDQLAEAEKELATIEAKLRELGA